MSNWFLKLLSLRRQEDTIRVLAVRLEPENEQGSYELVFEVDRFPPGELVYERRWAGTTYAYWSAWHGFVSFFSYTGFPDTGFGGRYGLVKLTSGRWEKIIGGWSANPRTMEEAGFPSSLPCVLWLTASGEERQWQHVTVERARAEIAAHGGGIEIVQTPRGYWEPRPEQAAPEAAAAEAGISEAQAPRLRPNLGDGGENLGR
jgi:hypothetical protein